MCLTSVSFPKKNLADGYCGKNEIIRATVGSSSAIVLADIDLFFRRPTNFLSVKVIEFSSASSNPWSSSDHQQTFFFFRSVISRSTFRHLNSFFFQCWLANTDCRPKMDRRSTGHSGRFWHRFWTTYRKPITVNIYLGRKALDMRTISSKNWSYTHVVAREYSAIA